MSAAAVFDRVSYSYPESDRRVLDSVSIEIPEGAFALVTGPTAGGKSTFLRAINGLVPHFSGGSFSGRVTTSGRDTLEHPPRALADVVAFVPQNPEDSFVLDRVEDELAYVLENLGFASTLMRRRVEETLDLMGIAHLRDRSVRTLSGGERQRVAVAAALTPGARIVVLDEPTSQLDPQGAEDVLAALQRLVHDLGMTVVLAEHRLERVAGFVDFAIGCAGRGRILAGEPRDVMAEVSTGPAVARLGREAGWRPVPLTVREARRHARELHLVPPKPDEVVAEGELLVKAEGVGARYGERPALSGVDLELRRGEVVALLGRNGAGKTTLLRCLAGLHEPAAGRIKIGGVKPGVGTNVSLCPQTPEDVLFKDSVEDEVLTTLRAVRSDAGVDEVLVPLGIESLRARHPRDLSAGQRLLSAVAAIVATGAPVLLLDEPTRGLDLEAKRSLGSFMAKHSREGTVLFATHDVELAAQCATRAVMLAEGEVIADGPTTDVLGDSPVFAPQMARVFGKNWLTVDAVLGAVLP